MADQTEESRKNFISLEKCLIQMFLLLLFTMMGFTFSLAQECDPKITPTNSALGYKYRGNRCEGFYVSNVSSGGLNIVGVTQGKFRFKNNLNEKIIISSPIVKDKIVYIRAVGIPLKTYYRMDAQISPNENLEWAVGDVLYPQELDYKRIGVYGYTGSEDNKTYVPLKVKSEMLDAPENKTIYVYLRASIDVMNVRWRFADVSEDGNCLKAGNWEHSLRDKYKSGNKMVIEIPENRSGVVCITVRADSQQGDETLSIEEKIILN